MKDDWKKDKESSEKRIQKTSDIEELRKTALHLLNVVDGMFERTRHEYAAYVKRQEIIEKTNERFGLMRQFFHLENFQRELYEYVADDIRGCELPLMVMIELYGKNAVQNILDDFQ